MARALIACVLAASLGRAAAAAPACHAPDAWATLGERSPFPAPDPAAVEANATGKRLYRERRWDEARAAYRSALTRDPSFLGPQLNLACSYVRQERYDEALAAVTALLARAYVPWAREVREAADLSALRPRREWATIEHAAADAAARWGAAALDGIVYVARSKPPVNMTGEGVFVLGLRQELVAYVPATGRHLPITAEDGRVLAFARSPDGRRIAYVLGGKLVRGAGGPPRLRDLSVRMLDLPSMQLGDPVAVAGDVTRVELSFASPRAARLAIARVDGAPVVVSFDGAALTPTRAPASRDVVVLDGGGAHTTTPRRTGPCGQALEVARATAVPGLLLRRSGAPAEPIEAPYGAALAGLAFPTAPGPRR